MKALCLLGTGDYKATTYVWRKSDKEYSYRTNLFPEAVAYIFQPEKILVLATPQVKQHANFITLCERLGNLVEGLDIPEGKSEQELWDVFQQCSEKIGEGDTILLDVTHAFRSLPLILFGIAAYLRRTKSVTIQGIVYGAYEARDLSENRSPIFDLTPLLDLLDWLSGVEALLCQSNAEIMGEKLKQTNRRLYKTHDTEGLPVHLQSIAMSLKKLSQALYLCSPLAVMKIASNLVLRLDTAVTEVEKWAKPFSVVLNQVRAEVAALAYPRPEILDGGNLRRQLALIDHYLRKGLTIQAVTLAREWVVSWAIMQQGQEQWLDRCLRERVEDELGALAAARRGEKTDVPEFVSQLPRAEQVADVWNRLADLRNILAHCWMRLNVPSLQNIEEKARTIPETLRGLLE